MSEPAVKVDRLGKQYRLGTHLGSGYGRLTESISNAARTPFLRLMGRRPAKNGYLWALRDVSLEIEEGEIVGIIGRNGAGKTTLLKILSRITEPTEGRAELHGRVGSLLEVGTGFHPELTGRENVYLNGGILGMRKSEIRRKFDEIVDFSGVERFIDTPVKRYSSGMYVRLAFAVAAHLEPEIMIVDEVLAVGDMAFQKKCLGRMGEVARSGRTVLFVSHNMGAVAELCSRAVLLEQGRLVSDGPVSGALEAYAELASGGLHAVDLEPDPSLPCAVLRVALGSGEGVETSAFDLADEIVITIRYQVRETLHGLQLTVTLARNLVDIVHSFDTDELPAIPVREPGIYEARYRLPGMFLKAGIYSGRVTLGTPERLIQEFESAFSFEIDERTVNTYMRGYKRERAGHVISPGTWETVRVGSEDLVGR